MVACGGRSKTDTRSRRLRRPRRRPPSRAPPSANSPTARRSRSTRSPTPTASKSDHSAWRDHRVGARARSQAGKVDDVVLGFDRLDGYLGTHPSFGAIVGRYANRIAKGSLHARRPDAFSWRPTTARTHLHGGAEGLRQESVDAPSCSTASGNVGVIYTGASPDGDEGYPGQRSTSSVTYTLTPEQRAHRRLRRQHRQGDADQPDAAQLLQPRRRRPRRHPRPSADDRRAIASRRSTPR